MTMKMDCQGKLLQFPIYSFSPSSLRSQMLSSFSRRCLPVEMIVLFVTVWRSELDQPRSSLSTDIFLNGTTSSLLGFNYTKKPFWFCVLWFVFHSAGKTSCTPELHPWALEAMFCFVLKQNLSV